MKKIFIALIFLFSISCLWADQLEDVYKRISAHPVTKGEFTQEQYIKVANRSLISRGNFVMAADKGVIFEIAEPFPSSMVVTEDKLVQTLSGNVVAVMDGKENAMFKNIAKIIHSVFSNDVQVLTDNFQVSVTGGPKDVVELVPKDPLLSMLFLKITLAVGDSIDSVSVIETGGNWVNYNFNNKSFPEKLTSDEEQRLAQ
ncbi:MAG: outer membrane lipoprotein carrier protein LolA [Spirochaetia bacterium]|nr:outer membrane lipoprotein carrier protein LolA [Spirochaetia bacterium]